MNSLSSSCVQLVGLCVQDYKSLCAVLAICAVLVNMKLDFNILTRVSLIWSQTSGESVNWCTHTWSAFHQLMWI